MGSPAKLALGAVVVLGLGAVAGHVAVQSASANRPLRIARGGDLVSLDPLLLESTTIFTISNVFEALVQRGRRMNIEPALAVRWSMPDERTWHFELREGVRFHDGTLLTAAEVKAAFDRVRNEAGAPGKHLLVNVGAVDILGERSLRVTTRAPDPLLLQRLSLFRVARGATTRDVEARPVGTGPYRVLHWTRGGPVELSAFDAYWGGAPAIRRVEILPMPIEKRYAALSRGELDLAMVPYETLASNPDAPVSLVRQVTLSRMFLWMCGASGTSHPGPLADRRVRQAVALALDRTAFSRALVGDPSAAATQLVPRTIFGFAPELAARPPDPASARRLLAQAGWPAGFELPLIYLGQSSLSEQTARTVAESLARVGIRTTPRAVTAEEVLGAFGGRASGLLVSLWTFDDGDAGSFLRDCVRSRDAAAALGLFNAGFSEPSIDRSIDGALALTDDRARLERYHDLMRRIEDEVPIVPLFDQVIVVGLGPGLTWRPRPDSLILAADVTRQP